LFVPELKGRSLEEVDELFEAKLWAWQFSKYQTSGIGHRIAELEDHEAVADKAVAVSIPMSAKWINFSGHADTDARMLTART
jgi:hypothetical protein